MDITLIAKMIAGGTQSYFSGGGRGSAVGLFDPNAIQVTGAQEVSSIESVIDGTPLFTALEYFRGWFSSEPTTPLEVNASSETPSESFSALEYLAIEGKLPIIAPFLSRYIDAIATRENVSIQQIFDSFKKAVDLYKTKNPQSDRGNIDGLEVFLIEIFSKITTWSTEQYLEILAKPEEILEELLVHHRDSNHDLKVDLREIAAHPHKVAIDVLSILNIEKATLEACKKAVRDVTLKFINGKLSIDQTAKEFLPSNLSEPALSELDKICTIAKARSQAQNTPQKQESRDVAAVTEATEPDSRPKISQTEDALGHQASPLAPRSVNTSHVEHVDIQQKLLEMLAEKLVSKKFLNLLTPSEKSFLLSAPDYLHVLIFADVRSPTNKLQNMYKECTKEHLENAPKTTRYIYEPDVKKAINESVAAFSSKSVINGCTLYDVASVADNVELVRVFFTQGVNTGTYNSNSTTSLISKAIQYHSQNTLRYLTQEQKLLPINWYDSLSEAIKFLDPHTIKIYIEDATIPAVTEARDKNGVDDSKNNQYTFLNKALLRIHSLCKGIGQEDNTNSLSQISMMCELLASLIKDKIYCSEDEVVAKKTLRLAAAIRKIGDGWEREEDAATNKICAAGSVKKLIETLKSKVGTIDVYAQLMQNDDGGSAYTANSFRACSMASQIIDEDVVSITGSCDLVTPDATSLTA